MQTYVHIGLLYFVKEILIDASGIEHLPKEIKEFVGNKNIKSHFSNTSKQFDNVWVLLIGFIDFMVAGKKLTDFTSFFSPYDFEENDSIIFILKMNKIDKTNLKDQTKYRLNEITKIEDHFNSEINQRKSCIKKLSKYVTTFDYKDKILIVLSATSGGVSNISLTSVAGAPVGIASASFTLSFSLTTGIIKKLLSITRNKKKKHYGILMLAKSKLSSIKNLVSQALIDMETSHEELYTIMNEEKKYEKMKKMWEM